MRITKKGVPPRRPKPDHKRLPPKKDGLCRHHIYNQGIKNSQGCDCPENVIYLTSKQHGAVHAVGRLTWFRIKGMMDILDKATSHHYARNKGETECSQGMKSVIKLTARPENGQEVDG